MKRLGAMAASMILSGTATGATDEAPQYIEYLEAEKLCRSLVSTSESMHLKFHRERRSELVLELVAAMQEETENREKLMAEWVQSIFQEHLAINELANDTVLSSLIELEARVTKLEANNESRAQ